MSSSDHTNHPISVVIITHQNPEYVRLCLRSLYTHQDKIGHQVVLVVDGPDPATEALVEQEYPLVDMVVFPENKGQTIAHNTGVTLATNDRILVVNDDNVFPPHWDTSLSAAFKPDHVLAPNQIEPRPSIFPDFIIKDFGITADTFDFDAYAKFADIISRNAWQYSKAGQTWPLFMEKKWYMILNGIDNQFPSPAVADWDFFLRAELAGLTCLRITNTVFYHFASVSAKKTPESLFRHQSAELQSFEYFEWKWGYLPRRNEVNSAKPIISPVNGISFT
jgi:GT2 family glycosyltransferase